MEPHRWSSLIRRRRSMLVALESTTRTQWCSSKTPALSLTMKYRVHPISRYLNLKPPRHIKKSCLSLADWATQPISTIQITPSTSLVVSKSERVANQALWETYRTTCGNWILPTASTIGWWCLLWLGLPGVSTQRVSWSANTFSLLVVWALMVIASTTFSC